jgi:3-hydroxyacyl-[acyl-carrier-protein] dehydratase
MPEAPLYDPEQFQDTDPIYDLDEIRKINPQRHAMEQLSAIVMVDRENNSLVGYKDVTEDEFWCTGHMPGFPLMPGVILCECAAQLAGFYARKYDILGGGDFLGFGGMENVRFRAPVFPGDRLLIMAKVLKVKPRRRAEFAFQGFVNGKMVYNGHMIGVPINRSSKLGGEA